MSTHPDNNINAAALLNTPIPNGSPPASSIAFPDFDEVALQEYVGMDVVTITRFVFARALSDNAISAAVDEVGAMARSCAAVPPGQVWVTPELDGHSWIVGCTILRSAPEVAA